MNYPIYFPNLGEHLANTGIMIDPVAITLFGMPIYWYGIIITAGIITGLTLAMHIAKKESVDPEIIFDFLMYDIVFAIVGARIYFVAFRWDDYKGDLSKIFDLRGGGIAIYGAIIASILVAIIYTRYKKISFFKFVDIAAFGLLAGQIIGRYGNFVNQEAFGGEAGSSTFLAMQIAKSRAISQSTSKVVDGFTTYTKNIVDSSGVAQLVEYVQVHPTFFYESTWNLLLLISLLVYRTHKKADGEIICLYGIGYGVGRFWIEGLRTDQLVVEMIGIPASQIVAILSIVIGTIGLVWCRKQHKIV